MHDIDTNQSMLREELDDSALIQTCTMRYEVDGTL